LLRLYDHDDGQITLDGIPIDRIDRQALRRQMAVVMQQPFLYSKTLAANVGMGRPDASRGDMTLATTTACVHDAILEFEDGYETAVGERGVTLSGGQRQRVALARALLQRPAILVLDDSLSAVDTETETRILDALRSRRGRQTTLVIAHRLSSVMDADQIVVLEGGCVTQRGTHADLVTEDGLYRRLWTIQSGAAPEARTSSSASEDSQTGSASRDRSRMGRREETG
jgi:ATP-binding cassette subfamily B protein